MWRKIKWLWQYYRDYKYVLFVLIVVTPMFVAIQVSLPRVIEFIIDYIKTGAVTDDRIAVWLNSVGSSLGLPTMITFMIAFLSLGINVSFFYAFLQTHRAWMNMRLEWLFRQKAFNTITLKGPDFFNKFATGDIVTRLTDDVAEKLCWFACSGIFRLYEAILIIVFTIVMMAMISPMLTLITVLPLPFLIIIFFKSATVLDERYEHLQTRISKLNALMDTCFSGIRVIKAYVQEKAQKRKFGEAINERRDAEISAIRFATVIDSLYMYIWQFGIIIVLLAGGYMVINAGLTLGELIAFVYYVIYLIFPMFDIGQFLVRSRQAAVSIDRLTELENTPAMVEEKPAKPGTGIIQGHIAFENVSFGFDGSEDAIVDEVSLEIRAGQKVALVGKVGAGKTWLVQMLPRLVDPVSGAIMLDGRDVRDYRLSDLRKAIGYVPQEPALFSDTIENNIVFGRQDISSEDINWAVDVAQLGETIAEFPWRLKTQIGTRGVSLSGGQKQRLSLARALVSRPKILILDDCTSALDSRTEAALWECLERVMPGRTVIMITHRPDMLEKADKIFILENGRLINSGTHSQLVRDGGHYAKLYRHYQLAQQVDSAG